MQRFHLRSQSANRVRSSTPASTFAGRPASSTGPRGDRNCATPAEEHNRRMVEVAVAQGSTARVRQGNQTRLPPAQGAAPESGAGRGYRAAINCRPPTPQQQFPKSALKGGNRDRIDRDHQQQHHASYQQHPTPADGDYGSCYNDNTATNNNNNNNDWPISAPSSAYNSLQRHRPGTAGSVGGQSPSRYGYFTSTNCPVFRPSATHLDKLNHHYHPDDGTYRCCNSEAGADSPIRNHPYDRPKSNMSYGGDSALSAGGFSAHSVGARDMLRYRARLKAQTPSAMAVQNDLEKLREEEDDAKASRLEYREQWKQSIDAQLEEKDAKKRREREEGLKQRVHYEDQADIDRREKLRKRQEQAYEIQEQKARDERMADVARMTDLERKKHERKLAAEAKFEEEERIRREQETKVRAQREFLQRAMSEQRERNEEAKAKKLYQKQTEKQLADAAKEAEDNDKAAARAEYRRQQEELLVQSRAQHLRKTLKDTRLLMDEEKALLRIREEDQEMHRLQMEKETDKKKALANSLQKQVREREAARDKEKAQVIADQQKSILTAQRVQREMDEHERHVRAAKKWQLQQELEEQMSYNTQKSLIDVATE